ncbi:hypothetical protein Tco_0681215 [Tanacetum coccineum]|uniref:Uncharacterized protein n=1 Tax=Tanacetum coccineum TaxID=301880 RepID=A0ABQ4XNN9_9ASTR
METFTSTISSLSSQVAEMKNIQWKLPAKFFNLPSQVSLVQEKLQTLDSLPSLLHKMTDTLNRFSTMVDNASRATSMHVPSAGQATTSPAEVLRILGSIFTSVYVAVQKLKDSWLELQFSLADNSKLNVRISLKEITPQFSFNHLAIPQARATLSYACSHGVSFGTSVYSIKLEVVRILAGKIIRFAVMTNVF